MKLAVTCFVVLMLCCLLSNSVAQTPGVAFGSSGDHERRRRDAPEQLSSSDGLKPIEGMDGPDRGVAHR